MNIILTIVLYKYSCVSFKYNVLYDTILQNLHEEKPIHTLSMHGVGTMPGHLPPPPPHLPPLAGLASLGLGPTQKEWDQLSMYSQRTDRSNLPRGRLYQMDRGGILF